MSDRPNEVKLDQPMPEIPLIRIALTLIALGFTFGAVDIYNSVSSPAIAEQSLKQMENSNEEYVVGNIAATADPAFWIYLVGGAIIATLWINYILKCFKRS